jgi:hypothetical protein
MSYNPEDSNLLIIKKTGMKCAEGMRLQLPEMINVCIHPNLERIVGHHSP